MKLLLSFLLFINMLNADPGLVILKSDDPVCSSLNKQALWLEKYLSIPNKSYTSQTELPSKIKNKTIFLTSLFFDFDSYMISRYADSIFCCQSMFETTSIPESWVAKLNSYFDFVTVPDEYLVDVYKNAGVQIPIYLLPMGSFIEDWIGLKLPEKEKGPLSFWLLEFYLKEKTTLF